MPASTSAVPVSTASRWKRSTAWRALTRCASDPRAAAEAIVAEIENA